MIKAPDIMKTPIELKLGDVWASANVKTIRPTTKSTAETYSWTGYLRLRPGMNAPIIITGKTWNSNNRKVHNSGFSRFDYLANIVTNNPYHFGYKSYL